MSFRSSHFPVYILDSMWEPRVAQRDNGMSGLSLATRTSSVPYYINLLKSHMPEHPQVQKGKKNILDVEGFEPSTSRMQSVRATTVPNAHE